MSALEVIVGRAVNPGGTLTAVTMGSGGDSATIRALNSGNAYLEGIWAHCATAGAVRVRSNRIHDAAQAIRYRVAAGVVRGLEPIELEQQVFSQDPMTIEISGGGAETDSVALMLYYDDLAGINARLATWDQIRPRIVNYMVQEVAIADPTTAGDWSAGNVLNANFDTLKAGVDYAVLGYEVDTLCTAVALRGSDTGNVKVGGPGCLEPTETRDWFVRNSRWTNKPMIPILNMANKLAISAFVCRNGTASTVNCGWTLAQLSSS